jgi:DNA-binding NarL/FixJ family response regulator
MTQRITVMIADDHPPTRAGVRSALEQRGFDVVAEVGAAAAAVDAAKAHRPDVCLVDIHMPGNGIKATEAISGQVPETAVVVLTVSRNDDDLFAALRSGAVGYLLKEIDPDRLPDALLGVLRGEAALPRTLVARLIDEFQGRDRRRTSVFKRRRAELTSREWQVLDLMRAGMSTAEMAERLFVSKVTVRTHVASILRKLRVPDRASALKLLDEEE